MWAVEMSSDQRKPSTGKSIATAPSSDLSNQAVDYGAAEAGVRRRCHTRAVVLAPPQMQPTVNTIVFKRPGDSDVPCWGRQSAVFHGISSQLMQSKTDMLRSFRCQKNVGPFELQTQARLDEGAQLQAHEIGKISPLPFLTDEQVVAQRDCLQALREADLELLDRASRARRLSRNRLDYGEQIL